VIFEILKNPGLAKMVGETIHISWKAPSGQFQGSTGTLVELGEVGVTIRVERDLDQHTNGLRNGRFLGIAWEEIYKIRPALHYTMTITINDYGNDSED